MVDENSKNIGDSETQKAEPMASPEAVGGVVKPKSREEGENANLKERLELVKLRLEVRKLRADRKLGKKVLDYLPGLGQLIALGALIFTVITGLNQQERQRQEGVEARFERVYARLGSSASSERASSVSQISALLHTSGANKDQEVLAALVNQLGLDDDAAVRSAILNLLGTLPAGLDKGVLDATLKHVIEMQRSIIENTKLTKLEMAMALRGDRKDFKIPSGDVYQDAGATENVQLEKLTALRSALILLLKAGAHTTDMREIYCPDCDFTVVQDLSGVDFSGAILLRTEWSYMTLRGAIFDNAWIALSKFLGADLQGARFSYRESNVDHDRVMAQVIRSNLAAGVLDLDFFNSDIEEIFPFFECANLRDTRFDDFPLLARIVGSKAVSWTNELPDRLQNADISGADFRGAHALVIEPVDSRKQNPPDDEVVFHLDRYYTLGGARWISTLTQEHTHDSDRMVEVAALLFRSALHPERAKLPQGLQPVMDALPKQQNARVGSCQEIHEFYSSNGHAFAMPEARELRLRPAR